MSRTPDPELFLRKLDQLGGSSGNTALMRDLGWASERYWRVRDELLDEGLVVKGRGKGGSVQANRPVEAAPRAAEARRPAQIEPERRRAEAALYEPFARVLRGEWARERRLMNYEVEVTAFGGRRAGDGTWTRPDITVVTRRSFTLVPQTQFDVWTFELKPIAGISVKAVFEALSHARRATRSFVALEVPARPDTRTEDTLERCEEEAKRHGLGFIKFTDAGDFDTWDMHLDAERRDTDGELLEEFLLEQLSDDARKRIRAWK